MTTPPPELTPAVRDELLEGLRELDFAFKHASAESVNARLWLEAMWRWQEAQKQFAVPVEQCHQ